MGRKEMSSQKSTNYMNFCIGLFAFKSARLEAFKQNDDKFSPPAKRTRASNKLLRSM